jgi:tRNA(fMet)-specific endonuclease VapC
MKIYLIDTDILLFFVQDDLQINSYIPILERNKVALSFMSVASMYRHISISSEESNDNEDINRFLSKFLIITADIEICRLWSNLMTQREATRNKITSHHAWISATAIRHNLPLVTNNISNFEDIPGLELYTAK